MMTLTDQVVAAYANDSRARRRTGADEASSILGAAFAGSVLERRWCAEWLAVHGRPYSRERDRYRAFERIDLKYAALYDAENA